MFDYLVSNKEGILLALFVLFIVMILVQWFCWTTGTGRFKNVYKRDKGGAIRYVVAEMFVKIINDFRHLLALLITIIFAVSLGYAMINAEPKAGGISDALQSVTSALGGLLGAIIGYYFGESAAKQKIEEKPSSSSQNKQVQKIDDENDEIVQAPSPQGQ